MHEESESEESDFDEEEILEGVDDEEFLIEEKLVDQQVCRNIQGEFLFLRCSRDLERKTFKN